MSWHIMKLVGVKVDNKTIYAVIDKDGGPVLPQINKGHWESVRDIEPAQFFDPKSATEGIAADGYWLCTADLSIKLKTQ